MARMAAKLTSMTNLLDISADLRKYHPQFHTCCCPVFKRKRVVCKESVEFVHLAAQGELRLGACAGLECAAATEYRPGPAMQTTGLRNVCQNPGLLQFSLPGSVIFRMKRHQGRGMSGWREILVEKKVRGKVARQLHWMSRIKPNLPHAAPLPRPKFMRISEIGKCFFMIEEHKKNSHPH